MPKKHPFKTGTSCIIFLLCLSAGSCFSQDSYPIIRFLGAARMTSGSCYLIDTGKTQLLIDFGLFYGEHEALNDVLDFDPSKIDFVFLTHAHIDHSGRIPLLYKKGFKGKIIGTDATKALTGIVLGMSAKVSQKKEIARYDFRSYQQMMENFVTIPYHQPLHLSPDLSVRFCEAGHIIGSAIIELWIKKDDRKIKIVATGDLGNGYLPLLKKPETIGDGDYILLDSTAGLTKRTDNGLETFGKEIHETLQMGGSVLIPAFVLDRTQRLLYVIADMKRKGTIPEDVPVYLDSTTAREITKIYRKYSKYFSDEALAHLSPLSFPALYELSSENALTIHTRKQPAVYITSSAMLDHANAPKHLEKMIDDPKNLLALVTWQAPGSLGWKLQRGAQTVQIPIEESTEGRNVRYVERTVRMRVKTFDMLSCHADGCQILTWLSNFPRVKEVFVVHGEKDNSVRMAEMITEKLGFRASAPERGAAARLSAQDRNFPLKPFHDLCSGMEASSMRDTPVD
jgi:metallo-beta-lactamase family protein